MDELLHLLHNPAHWAFEVITDIVVGGVTFFVGAILPSKYNPAKRWLARHDKEHHG